MEQKFKLKLESLRLKNFRAFRNAEIKNIPNYCVLVGANGVGKSTVFSVFEFLKDTLNSIATAPINQMCCAKCDYFYETTQDWRTRYRCSDCGKEFPKGVDLSNIVCFHFRPKML